MTRKTFICYAEIATAIESEEYMININNFIFDTEYIFRRNFKNIPYLYVYYYEEENSASIGEFIRI